MKDDNYQKGLAAAAKQADQFKKKVEAQTKKTEQSTSRMRSAFAKVAGNIQSDFGKIGGAFDKLGSKLAPGLSRLTPIITRATGAISKQLAPALARIDPIVSRVSSAISARLSPALARIAPVTNRASSSVAAAVGKMGAAFGSLSSGKLTGAIKAIGGRLAPALARIGPAVAGAAGAISTAAGVIGVAFAAIGAAGAAAATAVGGAVVAITNAAYKLAQVGAPLIGIQKGFEGLTTTVEGGATRMLKALQEAGAGMITNTDLMQKFNMAAQLVGMSFAEQLPNALGLLQKVAFSTGQSMDFLLNSLVVGVGRLSPLILDNLNITVDTALAYETYAASIDKSASSLSKAEKQTALMNQVLDRLRENTAHLPDVVGSAQAAFQGFRTDLANIRNEIGMRLAPVFAEVFTQLRKFMPALQTIGLGFAEIFVNMAATARSFFSGFLSGMGRDMDSIAASAQGWGENIVMSLARGMANAAGAIIAVLNAIGRAIANWLAPGSPPKLLPDIDDWGTAAMNEFIEGMTAADVDMLRDLSGKLESFIRSMAGDMDAADVAERILAARGGLEDALSGGGNLFEALPPSIHGYAQALLDAQAAADRVAQAQQELNAVTQEYEERLRPLNAELNAIEKRRQEVIDNQRRQTLQSIIADTEAPALAKELARMELREIQLRNQKDAIEEERDVAVDAAEDKLSAAEREQQAAEERLRMEEQLLQHQIETNNLLQETVRNLDSVAAAVGKIGGGGGGGAADLADQFEDLAAGVGGASNSIGSSISELAKRIQDEFLGVRVAAGQLGETWGEVFQGMSGKVRDFVAGFTGDVTEVDQEAAMLAKKLGIHYDEYATNTESTAFKMGQAFAGFVDGLDGNLTEADTKVAQFANSAGLAINGFVQGLSGDTVKTESLLVRIANAAGREIARFESDVRTGMQNSAQQIESFKARSESALAAISLKLLGFIADIQETKETWKGNLDLMAEIIQTASDNIVEKIDNLSDRLTTFITNTLDRLSGGMDRVRNAIMGVVNWLGNLITKVNNFPILPAGLRAMLFQSPPPLALGMELVRKQMALLAKREMPALGRQMNGLQLPGLNTSGQLAIAGGAVAPAQDTRPSVIIESIIREAVISNEMDMRELEARIRQVIRQETKA